MSQVRVVYGSMTTAILVLLSVEIGAILFLLGAQVIAEYERIEREPADAPQACLGTEPPRMGRRNDPTPRPTTREGRDTADIASR